MKWYGLLYHFLFFKGFFPQILLGPFLNTSSHIWFMSIFNNSVGVWDFSFYINLQKKAPISDNFFWKQLRKSTNSWKILSKINAKMFRQHNTINIIVSMESYETLPRKYTQQSNSKISLSCLGFSNILWNVRNCDIHTWNISIIII